MAAAAVYLTGRVVTQSQVSVANTNLDGTGTTQLCASGNTGGRFIDKIRAKAIATTVVGNIRFFYSPDAGVTKRLIAELAVTAITVAAGTNAWEGTWYAEGFYLADGNAQIYASTHIAASFNLHAEMSTP